MSDAALDAPVRPGGILTRGLELLPGLALLLAIGYAGKLTEAAILAWGKAHATPVPDIEYVLWAILYGLLIANVFGIPRIFRAGVATYEFWLKLGIVLLGVRFLLGDVLRLGGTSLILVAVELAASMLIMTWLGTRFGLRPKLVSLLAIGSSICGVSAIIAARGAIRAREEDVAVAMGSILLLGAVSLVLFPVIGHLAGMGDHAYGLWVGLAVDNTAEATAAGAIFSDEAARYAVLAKTTRNATIGFVVLGYALYWASRGEGERIGNKAAFLWAKFPKFVLGFLVISLLATLGAFSQAQSANLASLSRWAFLLTFAGVGLSIDLRALQAQGWRPVAVAVSGMAAIAVLTFVAVVGVEHLGLL
ncbi:MAG: YeiH family protein [Janthinobacterium lividum]